MSAAVVIELVAFVVWPFIGTRYGHRLTWRHGSTRLRRLVWTTGGRFVDGCPVYMPVLGRPPAGAHRHELRIPKVLHIQGDLNIVRFPQELLSVLRGAS